MESSSDDDIVETHDVSTTSLTPPSTPSDSSEHSTALTFFQLHILDMEHEEADESGYHTPDQIEPMYKRRRTNSGRFQCEIITPSFDLLLLSTGRVMRFHEEDGLYLLLPYWFESNIFVRKIVARAVEKGIKHRLCYLSKIMKEEEGYDEYGEMTHYHLRDQVCESYMVEMRLRNAMRKVLMRWRNYKMDKRSVDIIDPITLLPPIKQVTIYDWSAKKKFVFEAKSIATIVESNLLYHEGGFPCPQHPRNPWTNLDFTYRQLVSIYLQLKEHGELRWGLTTLREHNFNKTEWNRYHHSAITIKAIVSSIIRMDTIYSRELLEDFIIEKINQFRVANEYMIQGYRAAIIHFPNHWYIESWKALAIQQYEAQHFGLNQLEQINRACLKLLKQQPIMFKELISKNIIRH